MPAQKILPTSDVLRRLRREGKTYAEIADMYGVTKGAVYLSCREAGLTSPRPSYKDTLPWRVRTDHLHAYPAMMLRLYGRRQQGRGDTIPAQKARMLDRWLVEMRTHGLMVIYDPEIPSNPASRNGGFAYVPRTPDLDPDTLVWVAED